MAVDPRWNRRLQTGNQISVIHQVVGERGCKYDWWLLDYGHTNREIKLTDEQMRELVQIVTDWWRE